MIKTILLVPIRDNAEQAFSSHHWQWFVEEAACRFGGCTVEGEARGRWIDEDQFYEDVTRRYTIALDSWRRIPDWLAFIDAARERFQQIALYGKIADVPEIF